MRRLPAVAGAVASAALAVAATAVVDAAPALAGTPSIAITSPSGTLSTSWFTAAGTVSATSQGGTITGDLGLIVTSQKGHPGFTTTRSNWCGGASCSFSVPVPSLAWNGPYTVAVQATETDPLPDTSGTNVHPVTASVDVTINAPPATPRSVATMPAPDGSAVTVSWAPNSEPDLLGYVVTRTPSAPGSWPVAVTGTSFTDRYVAPATAYTYSVQAVRSGGTAGSTVSSGWASAAARTPAAPASSGSGGSGTSGPGASGGTSGAGSGSTSGAGSGPGGAAQAPAYVPGGARYSSAGAPAGAASDLASFNALLTRTAQATPAPALAAPPEPVLPEALGGAATDSPVVAPFSQGVGGGAARPARGYRSEGGPGRLQTTAAIALAALLVAVAAHLVWLRRQVNSPAA